MRILAFGIAVSLLALGQSVEASSKDRLKLARAKIARGDVLIKQTEYAGAEKVFRKAISIDPSVPTAYLGLGKSLVGQQRYDEALAVLEESERRFVAWEQEIQLADLMNRQLAERQQRDIQDLAAAAAGQRNSSSPSTSSSPQNAGSASLDKIETEQFLLRERFHLEAFESIPAQVFYLQGISYLRTNRRALGIEALEICLLIDSRLEIAHYNLAVALFTRGEIDGAKEHLDAAIAGGVEPHAKFVTDLERALGSQPGVEDPPPS